MSNLARFRHILEIRAALLAETRSFFTEHGYLEVETPIRLPVPAMEEHIDAEPSGSQFLRTSPELHMKRLVCAGFERIYQIGPCFRQGEFGDRHNPEYSMLEWYRTHADYNDILHETESLLGRAFALPGVTTTLDLSTPWPQMTVQQAFLSFAGWDPVQVFDADRFESDLVNKVEPALPPNRPFILRDYPSAQGALAESAGDGTCRRWELYLGGLEIANAYSELRDPVEQRRRFEHWGQSRKHRGAAVYPLDEEFFQALENGMPPCAGIALGLDRLVLLLAGESTLDNVLPFRTP